MDSQSLLQQCPVCTLYLHAGMSLETHLETHPMEQVIKALVKLACSTKSPIETFVSSSPPVTTTQYFNNDRRSSISCTNSNDSTSNDEKIISVNSSSSSVVKLFPTTSEITQLPPPTYTKAIEENSTFSQNFPNFQQHPDNFHYSTENYVDVDEEEEEEEIIEIDLETKETIQQQQQIDENSTEFYEKENEDFILPEENPITAEYTEEENGEFLLREKSDEKPNFSGLKVLSDVPVRVSDMTSSTGNFYIEYQNEQQNCETEINPFKSVIRQTEISIPEKSESIQRPLTKFFLNKQPKKLIVKFKKLFHETNSNDMEIIDETPVEKKVEEEKIDEKIRVKYHKRKNHLLENFLKDECNPVEELKKDENPIVPEELKTESTLLLHLEMTTEEECVSDYIGPFTPLSAKFEIEENENSFKIEPELQIITEPVLPVLPPISIEIIEEEKQKLKSENWLTDEKKIKEIPIDDQSEAGPSNRIDYSFPNLFANEQFLYSPPEAVNPHPNIIELNQENDDGTTTWHRQSFSPQYVTQFDNDRNSYMDLDACKTNNSLNCDQAASVDSLNIRTDEKMPAKGEISEQESNGDNGEGSWNNQVFHESVHRYPSSYDLSVAKDGWYLFDNEQENVQEINTTANIMPKFPPINEQEEDVKDVIMPPPIQDIKPLTTLVISPTRTPRIRHFRCLDCPKVFLRLKEKRKHLVTDHGYTKQGAKSSRLPKQQQQQQLISTTSNSVASTSTITSSNLISIFEIKIDPQIDEKNDIKPVSCVSNYLENEQKILNSVKTESTTTAIGPIKKIKRTYICAVCKETFSSISSFDQHLAIHPAACHLCDRTFKRWSNISLHLKRHLGIKNHICKICNKRFLMRQKLLEHLRTHSGVTPISCSECPLKFRRYSNLVQHKNRHHRNIKRELKDYVCHCGEVFHTKPKFNWHKEIHDQKPKGCPHCRERFIHTNSLQRHIRLTHPEKYNFKLSKTVNCPICSKLYLKSSIKIHINTHRVLTEYKCTICQKAFSTKWNLKQHRWIHACRSTKPFKCKIPTCTKAFVRETDFLTHMNAHKAIKPYICDYCGCQFSRKYNKLRHVREHESPKKHVCTICNKSFHRAYYLTEHLRIHSGERKFSCNICGKTSATKTNHNKHIKIHHARDPLTAEN